MKTATAMKEEPTTTTDNFEPSETTGLGREDELLVLEAARRGEKAQRQNHERVVEFGDWLVNAIFGGDTAAALDPRPKNQVWLELRRRAGASVHVSKRFLYVALRIAAYDRTIADDSWRHLDVGRKELLLPLADPSALVDAARHVSAFDLSQRTVRAYVAARLALEGDARHVRWTAPQITSQLERLNMMLVQRASVRRLRELASQTSHQERTLVLQRARALQKTLNVVTRELGK